MKKGLTTILSALSVALVLMLGLAACGGGGGGGAPTVDYKKNFVGTWDLVSMGGEDAATEEEVELMKSMGQEVFVNFDEDGSFHLVLFGSTMDGTWKAKDASTATVTIEDSNVDATLKDGQLTMEEDGESMVFKKGEAKEPPANKTDSDSLGDVLENAGKSSGEEKTALDPAVTIADDATCSIVVTAKGVDWGGDPGYYLTITNKSDKDLSFSYASGSFSVNGKMADPALFESVKAGKYAEAFMWFSHGEVGEGMDALTAVEGTLEVYDSGYNTVGSYEFKM